MIDINDVKLIHQILIEKFGGSYGIRDIKLLESALARPFQTFDEKDLYQSPVEKAAALLESILINHPFIDGNKRIGYVLMRLLLINNDLDISANEEEKYKFVISVSQGTLRWAGIIKWLNEKVVKIEPGR
jgi:death on curing protein